MSKLREICEAATPKKWQRGVAGNANIVQFNGEDVIPIGNMYHISAEEFVATFNPARVLRMVGALEFYAAGYESGVPTQALEDDQGDKAREALEQDDG